MSVGLKSWPLGFVILAIFTALGLFVKPIALAGAGQTSREADGARLLRGAVDMHFHVDPGERDFGKVKVAASRGVRALVLKHHNEPTATTAYHLRKEIRNLDLFGGIVLNRSVGGINAAAVEYMVTIKGASEGVAPGRVVWMPAGDSEIEVRTSKNPDGPFVRVSRGGELLPEVKAVISVIAKHGLVLASGHVAPEEALTLFREARRQGVQHMVATHAMDLAGRMNLSQMQEAATLGAIIEVDFRNVLDEGGWRADAIRKIGPDHCLISEFWTSLRPLEYGGLDGVGAFVAAMRAKGFTDRELDLMFKENPARLLGLSVH
jgi:Family of unknown function (DUF6282)